MFFFSCFIFNCILGTILIMNNSQKYSGIMDYGVSLLHQLVYSFMIRITRIHMFVHFIEKPPLKADRKQM